MEKARPRCGQPSDRGRLKDRTEQRVLCKNEFELVLAFGAMNSDVDVCGRWSVQVHRHLSPDASAGDQHGASRSPDHRRPVDGRRRLLLAVARPVHDRAQTARRRPLHLRLHLHAAARTLRRLLHGRPHHLLRHPAAHRHRPVRTDRADALPGRRRSRRQHVEALGGGHVRRGRSDCAQTLDVPAPAEQHLHVVGQRQQVTNTGRFTTVCRDNVIRLSVSEKRCCQGCRVLRQPVTERRGERGCVATPVN